MLDPARCPRCTFRREVCLCGEIPRVETRTRIVILRHHGEHDRSSNSGRLAHLALPNSELRDLFGPGETDRHADLALGAGAWLLFPEGAARTVAPVPAPATVVVLDATWAQARRMRQRLTGLRGVPVLSVAPVPAAVRMRRAPAPGMVSTIEAIAGALQLLEGSEASDPLVRVFEAAVARMQRAGRPLPGAEPWRDGSHAETRRRDG